MVASLSVDAISVDIGAVIYPDCDGQPMSDNTKQLRSPRDTPVRLTRKAVKFYSFIHADSICESKKLARSSRDYSLCTIAQPPS
ncbi:MAG: hypothetical protein NT070_22190 [Cyanobacteria bacterium]|nr:hypothetical protein [Cyanobacteriota bacterium]